jgi:conserved oligomeric Golgi complex subunit 6
MTQNLRESLLLLAQTRSSALAGSFLDALTRGGPGGLPRPIELHAHDPLRYVGDMLAWVHQALAGERELAEALLREQTAPRRMVGAARFFGESLEENLMRDMVDGAVGRLCAPLKVGSYHQKYKIALTV